MPIRENRAAGFQEVVFRGHMHAGIERHDRQAAIWITSVVFVASHVMHGVAAVLVLAPAFFAVSMPYGTLARRTGTKVPGMVIHTVDDLARVYFGVLRGDGSLFIGADHRHRRAGVRLPRRPASRARRRRRGDRVGQRGPSAVRSRTRLPPLGFLRVDGAARSSSGLKKAAEPMSLGGLYS